MRNTSVLTKYIYGLFYLLLSPVLSWNAFGLDLNQESSLSAFLPKGTQGQILNFKKYDSGSYAVYVKVLNGPEKNRHFWIHQKNLDTKLNLFSGQPSKSAEVNALYKARGFTVAKDISALRQAGEEVESSDEVASVGESTHTVKLINKANATLNTARDPYCENCSSNTISGFESILRRGRSISNACSAIITPSGQYGPTGQAMAQIMSERKYISHFTADNSLGAFCPKFNRLSDAERLQAWTWFWTALAHEESSCVSTKVHATHYRDKNGKIRILNPRLGYGLWALEKDRNIRRSRGAACANIYTVAGQARCAIDIMYDRQLSKGKTAGINYGSYWGPVRRGSMQIIPHMRRFKLCF